ncbi:Fungal specific transcription factor domain family protein [Aspergillus niger]|uniref:Fungal specific transcription factor domain family protein n=1 Tax=Aspergillus niger TaxID=5061 RepID=A0A505IJ07_ASPNG|nr:Fungal specific transcription factor domain family protein [Aspergillus niger]
MEISVADDKMEMASPYQGHVDDFDIDIDIMEDQASVTDKDMMVADEYFEYDHDGTPDEDMVDDVAEPTMVDADEPYTGADYTVEMQDENERIYEAEMLEDDYEEDNDTPVVEAQDEAPISAEAQNQAVEGAQLPEESAVMPGDRNDVQQEFQEEPRTDQQSHADAQNDHPQDAEQLVDQSEEHAPQQPEIDTAESTEIRKPLNDSNTVEQESQNTAKEDDRGETANNSDQPQERSSEEQVVEHPAEREAPATERTPLYPVKVYYQDNEISLFPPREGDSSETFFLEDESLAFGSFGKLFESCRDVLREHIGDGDVLVVDVEALNIQLTEDSLHIDKVTLHQIVDLYLRLCHNDGVEEPEALYLSLSTRPTVAAELSSLSIAANEGKGLSEVYWDGYGEGEAASAEVYEDNQEVFIPDDVQQESSEPEDVHSDFEGNYEPEVDSSLQTETAAQQQGGHDDQDHEDHDQAASDNGDAGGPTSSDVREGDNDQDSNRHEAHLAQSESAKSVDHHEPNESYESEEQSESTATVTQQPLPDSADDLAHHDHDHDYDEHETEYYGTGVADEEAYREEETNVDATEHYDYQEDAEAVENADISGEADEEFDGDATAPDVEEPLAFEEVHDNDQVQDGTVDTDFHDLQDDEGEVHSSGPDEDASKETKTVPDRASQDIPEVTNKSAEDLKDDSLGTAEDLLKSPRKDLRHAVEDTNVDELEEPGEIHDEAEAAPATHEEADELTFDDEDYLDLGVQDGLAAGDEADLAKSPSRGPTKRHREAEDEFEFTETPTPDAKRSRSS